MPAADSFADFASAVGNADHVQLARAMLSLEGLSCGDGFGECFFLPITEALPKVEGRVLPPGPWTFTDDTMMAISIVETLRLHARIVEDHLAGHFARLYDPDRGYGSAMHGLLARLGRRGAEFWREESRALFNGGGSFGNGAAMRVAPLGAYFADDLGQVVEQAGRSAVTTHAHAEAVAGAIAIALGAAFAWRTRTRTKPPAVAEFLQEVRALVPPSQVREGIDRAIELPSNATAKEASTVLGNGWGVSAMDTVPFCLWSAARWLGDYEEAMWQTLSALGDRDTTCAIVGGMVALRVGIEGIPMEWRRRREPIYPLFMNR